MALDREKIACALFGRLQDKVNVRYATRRAIGYEEIGSDRVPSLELYADSMRPAEMRGFPTAWRMTFLVVLYVTNTSTDPETTPETVLFDLARQVEAALERQSNEPIGPGFQDVDGEFHTTLGGLVSRAWVGGEMRLYQGNSSGQGWLEVPVEVLATA